jgi:ABC-type branched-subunit amino acid transport system ATPase component/predicted acylesterase/phospholipase RssA
MRRYRHPKYLPDWVAAISIGAINAAIIAGNAPEHRVERLKAFWGGITAPLSLWPILSCAMTGGHRGASSLNALMFGQPGFFSPRPPIHWLLGPASTSYYDTSALKATLERLVDFDRINAREIRFSVGAVNVRTGNFAYFDNAHMTIRPEHVMASGALPPGFPAVEIDGECYWDGGLVSNTPLQYVVEYIPRRSRLTFQVDLFHASGRRPANLEEVGEREKDIRYSSRTRAATDMLRTMHDENILEAALLNGFGRAAAIDHQDLVLFRDRRAGGGGRRTERGNHKIDLVVGGQPFVEPGGSVFPEGVITTIVGSNGAGKSTVVKVAAGLLRAWKGNIFVHGADITREPADRRVRRGIAYVPQGRIVVPEMTVRDNLMIGAHILGNKRVAIEAATERVLQLFPALKSRMKQQADTMSGGEQQMLAIGRALMTTPEIIMLDEPSLGLSPKFVEIVFEKLLSLRNEGLTVVMVEQKAPHALGISDRAYVMHLGQVACEGSAADLLGNDDVKRLFLGEIPESMKGLSLTDA